MDEISDLESSDPIFNNNLIIKRIRVLHSDFTLCGEPRNELLNFSDETLMYIISLLKNEKAILPNLSIGQWHKLIDALDSHWIIPLLYWQIGHMPLESKPPKAILDILRSKSIENVERTVRAEHQIKDIINAFSKEGIKIILLKGCALARIIYLYPDIRSGSDIDLLVLPNDVSNSRKILEDLGYKCFIKYFDISKNLFCEEEFRSTDSAKNFLQVEIHWNLKEFPALRGINDDQFIYRSNTIKTPKLIFDTLDPIDSLIHSALHLCMKHNRDIRLSWIFDISLLCNGLSSDDWKLLQKRCVECGARISIEKCIVMAQLWTGLKVPPEFDDFTKWPEPTKNEAITFLYATKNRGKTTSHIILYWPKSTTILEKINILRFCIFPPRELIDEHNKIKNNRDLITFYINRWLRLLKNI